MLFNNSIHLYALLNFKVESKEGKISLAMLINEYYGPSIFIRASPIRELKIGYLTHFSVLTKKTHFSVFQCYIRLNKYSLFLTSIGVT